jgi:hypothetical protein
MLKCASNGKMEINSNGKMDDKTNKLCKFLSNKTPLYL